MAERDQPRSGEGRLARWSRLKREAVAEKTKEAAPRQAPAETKTSASIVGPPAGGTVPVASAPPSEADKTEEQRKLEEVTKDLPPVESLGKDSDYTLFMREGVPEEQRVAALRKLWRSDPAFTEQFPFEIHMEDYNKTFTPINAATDTIFRAGLGYLFDDDKSEADKPAGKELVDKSMPRVIEVGGEQKSDSAELIPPAKEEIDKNSMVQTSVREGTSEKEKSPSGSSHSG